MAALETDPVEQSKSRGTERRCAGEGGPRRVFEPFRKPPNVP
jgi:hypothetical protein